MKLTSLTSQPHNHRILIIDDNPSIHEDFRKILGPADAKLAEELDATEASLFGDHAGSSSAQNFRIDSAFQGKRGSRKSVPPRSEEHTSELQSQSNLVCRLLLEKKQQS